MKARNDGEVESESLRTQLSVLNERSRWYSSQLWQVPFAFLGLGGLAIGAVIGKNNAAVIGWTFVALGCFGIAVIIHMYGMAGGERRAVQNIQKVEEQLHLEQTALAKAGINWRSLHIAVIVATILSFVLGIYLLRL